MLPAVRVAGGMPFPAEALAWEARAPRAATALEPERADPPRPLLRRLLLVLTAAVAAVSAFGAAAVGVEAAQAGRLSPLHLPIDATAEDLAEPIDGVTPLARLAISGEESSRARHRLSAGFRDLWRASTWFHPLTGERVLPERAMRKFGAERGGDRPAECGRGHCGVDLGKFGLIVRAAQPGTIERIQARSINNAGRYVRITHDDGFESHYLHLHRIRPGLREGMRVSGGEPIGVVGRSGIKRSEPHLHFALAYRDGARHYYVDPEPMLRHALPPTASTDEPPALEPDGAAPAQQARTAQTPSPTPGT
jgi:murein DD-endopeptidase MepM/ murein hydrolase activator NlpD